MKYNRIIIILCLGLIILLGVFYRVSSNDNQVGQWTQEEKLEDFNYLYNILKENYPYFELLKRQKGYDWLAHKEEFETMIANTKDDLEYYHTLDLIISKISQGHTNLLPPSTYIMFKDIYNNLQKEYPKGFKQWCEIINNKKSEKTYSYIQDLLQQQTKNASKGKNNESSKTEQENLILNIIEENKIAYVRIKSFSQQNILKDGPILMEFWNKIKNYPYLIIDITENSGGSDLYWIDYIVRPLINETIEYELYSVYRGGEYSMPFIEARQIELYPISELPPNPNYPPELNKDFKYFSISRRKYEPRNSVGFSGDIFILTNEKNFSSAESFCIFAKDTNWATLIGERTKGDGGGFDPILVCLPNSGLLVRLPTYMGLNPDGTANEEFGTVPDIKARYPLVKAINIINSEKNNETGGRS